MNTKLTAVEFYRSIGRVEVFTIIMLMNAKRLGIHYAWINIRDGQLLDSSLVS